MSKAQMHRAGCCNGRQWMAIPTTTIFLTPGGDDASKSTPPRRATGSFRAPGHTCSSVEKYPKSVCAESSPPMMWENGPQRSRRQRRVSFRLHPGSPQFTWLMKLCSRMRAMMWASVPPLSDECPSKTPLWSTASVPPSATPRCDAPLAEDRVARAAASAGGSSGERSYANMSAVPPENTLVQRPMMTRSSQGRRMGGRGLGG